MASNPRKLRKFRPAKIRARTVLACPHMHPLLACPHMYPLLACPHAPSTCLVTHAPSTCLSKCTLTNYFSRSNTPLLLMTTSIFFTCSFRGRFKKLYRYHIQSIYMCHHACLLLQLYQMLSIHSSIYMYIHPKLVM